MATRSLGSSGLELVFQEIARARNPSQIAMQYVKHEGLELTRDAARQIVAHDPQLTEPDHQLLRDAMLRRFGKTLELGTVG